MEDIDGYPMHTHVRTHMHTHTYGTHIHTHTKNKAISAWLLRCCESKFIMLNLPIQVKILLTRLEAVSCFTGEGTDTSLLRVKHS